MMTSGTGRFSTPQYRYCRVLSGLRPSFSSAKCLFGSPGPQSVARMPHLPSFPLSPPFGGFLRSGVTNKVRRGISVWNDLMTRFKGGGTWDRMIGIPGMNGVKVVTGAAATVLLLALANPVPALADTIEAALVRAYQNNPQLNAQRAAVRATDETVPQALSGYRPKVAVTASAGYQYTDLNSTFGGTATQIVRSEVHGTDPPRSAGLTVTQTLYNGNQTANKTRVAESQVSGAREGLRVLEQTVLLSAATIYMDYLRDSAIVEVNQSNVRVLDQTLKQTQDRFNVGEVTRTDVAQSEAQLAAGKTQLRAAQATRTTTQANFRRIIGNEPQALAPGSPVDRYLPGPLPAQ